MTRRGDVVIAVFPYIGGGGAGKNRPAVVVQCDRLNNKLQNTIVVMVTGNTRLIGKEPTQFLIDPGRPIIRASQGVGCKMREYLEHRADRHPPNNRAPVGSIETETRRFAEGGFGDSLTR